jgi:hypothetical protein
MKKSIVILVLILISVVSFSQQNAISKNVKKQIEILKKADLNLTELQLSRIAVVLSNEDAILQKNIKSFEGNKSILETRIAEIKANRINNIKGAMTPQQVEKFDAIKLAEKLN